MRCVDFCETERIRDVELVTIGNCNIFDDWNVNNVTPIIFQYQPLKNDSYQSQFSANLVQK